MAWDSLPNALLYLWSAIFGAVLGSFGNVLIYRLPREQSIVKPASRCPHCGHRIRAFDNIPVISYLILRGQCRDCGERISIRYPLIELASGLLFLGAAIGFGWSLATLFYGLLLVALLVLSIIDIEEEWLPWVITFPMTAIGLLGAVLGATLPFIDSLIGGASGLAFFGFIALLGFIVKRETMGGGDIVFGLMAGTFLGWEMTFLMIFLACLLGLLANLHLVVFVILRFLRLVRREREIKPIIFGPFLSVGTALVIFWGDEILSTGTTLALITGDKIAAFLFRILW
ncbi:prepilin peptidase [bacterium]|nr:prepilin peptidase [bacterium]MBU1937023.1 prepilin peptidase [bacterium]